MIEKIPTWVCSVTEKNGLEITHGSKLLGGVVSDVWKIGTENGHSIVFRRTVRRDDDSAKIVSILNSIAGHDLVPHGLSAWLDGPNAYITTYDWVEGNVLSTFERRMISELGKLKFQGKFEPISSIYNNIHLEAVQVNDAINEFCRFNKAEKCCIKTACRKVKEELDNRILREILDNRGFLTHGDIKPANVIKTGVGMTLIDWDKVCSLSPEADIVYMLFTGKMSKKICSGIPLEKTEVFDNACYFLPDMYVIHDCFVYLKKKTRFEYIRKQVIPLWDDWDK